MPPSHGEASIQKNRDGFTSEQYAAEGRGGNLTGQGNLFMLLSVPLVLSDALVF